MFGCRFTEAKSTATDKLHMEPLAGARPRAPRDGEPMATRRIPDRRAFLVRSAERWRWDARRQRLVRTEDPAAQRNDSVALLSALLGVAATSRAGNDSTWRSRRDSWLGVVTTSTCSRSWLQTYPHARERAVGAIADAVLNQSGADAGSLAKSVTPRVVVGLVVDPAQLQRAAARATPGSPNRRSSRSTPYREAWAWKIVQTQSDGDDDGRSRILGVRAAAARRFHRRRALRWRAIRSTSRSSAPG